jgi:hypothetical protein
MIVTVKIEYIIHIQDPSEDSIGWLNGLVDYNDVSTLAEAYGDPNLFTVEYAE